MRNPMKWRAAVTAVALIALLGTGALAAPDPDGSAKAGPKAPVDLNEASLGELTAIPGIGDTMAQRILDWRAENGPFRQVDDLMKVKGIGEKSLEKIRPYVKVAKPKAG